MLCSLPERAQPPIVDGRKWMLVAARISAASARVIQSFEAAIGQSVVFDAPDTDVFSVAFDELERDELDDSDESGEPADPGELADSDPDFLEAGSDPSASDDAATSLFEPSSDPEAPPPLFDAAVVLRSFLAQPDPL